MALKFYRKTGMVLACCFDEYILPEIVKTRSVVVISPTGLIRPKLVTVVPLSTTVPDPVEPYHYKLKGNPIPAESSEINIWAKCDLVATVSYQRLDRVRVRRGKYEVGHVGGEQIKEIRLSEYELNFPAAEGCDGKPPRTICKLPERGVCCYSA